MMEGFSIRCYDEIMENFSEKGAQGMKTRVIVWTMIFMIIASFLPQNHLIYASNQIEVTADVLNVRSGPGLSYSVVGTVKKGDKYTLIQQKGDWIEIQYSSNKKGWVASWHVKFLTPNSSNGDGVVTADGLRIRKGPGTNYSILAHLNKNDRVSIIQTSGNWLEISFQGMKGWVSREFVQTSTNTNSPSPTQLSGKVTASLLNVRNQPSLQGSVIGMLNKNDTVAIHAEQNNWYQISFNNGKAWVSKDFIQVNSTTPSNDKPKEEPVTVTSYGKVKASVLNVRDSQSLNGNVIGTVLKDQTYKLIEEKNNWYKIEFAKNKFGWVAGWYIELVKQPEQSSPSNNGSVTTLYDGTNIRKGPGTNYAVISRVNKGNQFKILQFKNDWYEIELANGQKGYVAGWIVTVNGTTPSTTKPGSTVNLKGKTIVIDPGHGGADGGTVGARGTIEKDITLRTSNTISEKLKAAGANVILTRSNDKYVSLSNRVSIAHYYGADAFISVHYDSFSDQSVHGITSYYYHNYQKSLAQNVQSALTQSTGLYDRGVRFGNYQVLRTNSQPAILLELGYLSNPIEEMTVSTATYHQSVALGILNGLNQYFK